jgi:nucleotide-binding universal stress UspA family protein
METNTKTDAKYNSVILIPTDFSEVCENAISHGVELAQFLHYKVCLLHVVDKKTESILKKEKLPPDCIDVNLQKYKEDYGKKYGVEIETMTRKGTIFKVISEVAVEIKANLMVLGTHGKQGLQYFFGSHALKVVLDTPCPVVVVQKRAFCEGYHEIVLPLNNVFESRQKVEWVLLMSKLFNSKIHLFQSLESDPGMNNRLKIITEQITTVFDEHKIPYEINVAEKSKDYVDQVINYAVSKMTDLIMIITVPNVDVPGFSLSEWDERLMFNEAQIPVMCINPVILGQYLYDWGIGA